MAASTSRPSGDATRPGPPLDPIAFARRSTEIAVVTDESGEVLFWNTAATKLLGRRGKRGESAKVFPEIVEGRDIFGNRIFHEANRFRSIVQRGETVQNFAFDLRTRTGTQLRVAASVLVFLGPDDTRYRLVYLLRPIHRRRRTDVVIESLQKSFSDFREPASTTTGLQRSGQGNTLTPRQREVVRLIADGKSSGEIADALRISVNTVRNHTQDVLKRLDVHSKTEAVAVSLRRGLI